jgi:hypothetical protein
LEEVDHVLGGGFNLGWPLFEGEALYLTTCPESDLSNLVMPVHAYDREAGRTVIVAGFARAAVREGASFPYMVRGAIFFADFYTGWLRCLEQTENGWQVAAPLPGQPSATDFGQGYAFATRMRFGEDGRLWYLQGDQLRRISYVGTIDAAAPPDLVPGSIALRGFPSPTTGAVTFEFELPRGAAASLRVADVRGRILRRHAIPAAGAAGTRRWAWDGRDEAGREAPPGVYFATVSTGGASATRRILRIRG